MGKIKKNKQNKSIQGKKTTFFERDCSEETNNHLNQEIANINLTAEELELEKVIGKKDVRVSARRELQTRLIAHDYTGLTFIPERPDLDTIIIFDHNTGFEHEFGINFSYLMDNPNSKYTQLHDVQKYIESLNDPELIKKEYGKLKQSPKWKLIHGGFQVDASEGVFLDYPEESVDFIPCILTPLEVCVSRTALLGLGKGDVRRGGYLMMMLNSIWAHKGKELIKKGKRIT